MTLDAGTAALLARLKEMGGGADRDMGAVDAPAARAASRAMWQAFIGPDEAHCHVETVDASVPARLYRPEGKGEGPRPLVVFLHGGGWAMGALDDYEPLVKDLAERSGALFLSVDYRLAPEHKFPAGLDDALAAVRWASSHAADLGADAARLAVMGDSAGGNLAAVIARNLRGSHLRLAAQFLLYPVLDVASPHKTYPSRMRFGDGAYLLTRRDIDVTTQWYLDTQVRADDPEVSPLLAEDLAELPPAVILTAGHDPLRDEAKAYTARLRKAGVPTDLRCFESTIHAFLSFGVLPAAAAGRAWLATRVRRLLGP